MALVTTIMTTPFVIKLYPDWYQKQQAALSNDSDLASTPDSEEKSGVRNGSNSAHLALDNKASDGNRFTMVTVLNRMETIPAVMALMRLLKMDVGDATKPAPLIHALRLLELTQRPSDVMKIQEMKETLRIDPVLSVIRTFASLIGIKVETWLDFAAPADYIKRIDDYSSSVGAQMVLLPWKLKNTMSGEIVTTLDKEINPLDRVVSTSASTPSTPNGGISYQVSDAEFATHAFTIDHCIVGLFLDRGFGNVLDGEHYSPPSPSFRIVVPFLGGKDDRAALLFALQLQTYRHADVLVLRQKSGDNSENAMYATEATIHACLSQPSAHLDDDDTHLFGLLFPSATPELNVSCQYVDNVSAYALLRSNTIVLGRQDLVVLGRRHKGASSPLTSSHIDSPGAVYSKEFSLALGPLAFDLLSSGVKASLVVIQAPSGNLTNVSSLES